MHVRPAIHYRCEGEAKPDPANLPCRPSAVYASCFYSFLQCSYPSYVVPEMRYIRFLKPPRIIQDKSSSQAHISCLITITSDLGDSFLPFDLTLSAELIHRRNGVEEVLVWKIVQWTGAMRSLAISLPLSKSRRTWPLRVRIGTEPKSTYDEFSKLLQEDSRGVVSAWSTEIDPSKSVHEAEKLIERRIDVELKTPIIIWEETGESIARHLWY